MNKLKWRGSEYDIIRPATPYDDARDIAWKQSTKTELPYVKSREDTIKLSIQIIGIEDSGWEFSLEQNDTKKDFYRKLDISCKATSIYHGHTYESKLIKKSTLQEIGDDMRKRKIQKRVSIFVCSSLDISTYEKLYPLAHHNDIIIIHLLHPYESDPTNYTDYLFGSRCVDATDYLREMKQKKEVLKKYLSQKNISYISALSIDDPVNLLNYFFKNRYAL